MTDERELIRRLGSGESGAWTELLEQYGPLVLSVGKRLGLGREERQDLFQNVFLKVSHSLVQLRNPEKLASWLYTIAYNEATRLRSAVGRDRHRELDTRILDSTPDPGLTESQLRRRLQLAREVAQAMRQLAPRCANLLRGLYLDDPTPSYLDLAEALKIPVGSIGPTRARCMAKLKRILSRVSDGEVPESTPRKL